MEIHLSINRFAQTFAMLLPEHKKIHDFESLQEKERRGFCQSSSWWSASDQRQGWPGAMPNDNSKISQKPTARGPPPDLPEDLHCSD